MLGVECALAHLGAPDARHPTMMTGIEYEDGTLVRFAIEGRLVDRDIVDLVFEVSQTDGSGQPRRLPDGRLWYTATLIVAYADGSERFWWSHHVKRTVLPDGDVLYEMLDVID